MPVRQRSSRVPAARRVRGVALLAPALALALAACGDPLAVPIDGDGPGTLAPEAVALGSVVSHTGPNGISVSIFDFGQPSQYSIIARAVNSHGQFTGEIDRLFSSPRFHPFRAEADGTMTLLGPDPFPDPSVYPLGINDDGVVVGWGDAGRYFKAFRWTDANGYEILPGTYRYGQAFDINNAGQIVGQVMPLTSSYRPVVWDGPNLNFLDYAGGYYGYGVGISEDGRVAGRICTPSCIAHYWPGISAQRVSLGTLGGSYSYAADVNSSGIVVGYSQTATGQVHPFRWTAQDGMTDLGTFGGPHGYARGINEDGTIVGYSYDTSNRFRPFVWTPTTGMVELPMPATHDQYGFAFDISGSWVAGWVQDNNNGRNRAALWNLEGAAPNEPPIANAGPDQTVECGGPDCGEVYLDGSGSSDPNGDDLTYTWYDAAGTELATGATPDAICFGLGSHTVTLVVSDGQEEASDEVVIHVVDTVAPSLELAVSPESVWPPNHGYVAVDVTALAEDLCDEAVVVSGHVTSSEPDDARGNGDGRTTGDIRVTHGDGAVSTSSNGSPSVSFDPTADRLEVRAERAGRNGGRIYTVTVTATDAGGNSATRTATVRVAHDRGR